jgi:hypothetical protein
VSSSSLQLMPAAAHALQQLHAAVQVVSPLQEQHRGNTGRFVASLHAWQHVMFTISLPYT